MRFKGKVVLVTGGSRGIGRAIALRFAREGADVVINYLRKRTAAEETVAELRALGVRAHAVKANLRDPDKIPGIFQEVREVMGGLDILILNAASGVNRPAMEVTVRDWEWTLGINARSALLCAQQAAPMMRERGGGKIVAVSSLGSIRVLPDYTLVGISKAALETLVRYLAVELAPWNIVVNGISAGVVPTDALKFFRHAEQMLDWARQKTPAGRLLTPEDLAGVVAFLCSEDAAMIRGQILIVDGGFSLMP